MLIPAAIVMTETGCARAPGRWPTVQRADLPRRPLPYFPRPEDAREVIRHKSFASEPMTVDEAAYEMDLLDHDFFLYLDADSGRPALVHRLPPGGYGVRGVAPAASVATVTFESMPPRLSDDEARRRLEADDERDAVEVASPRA